MTQGLDSPDVLRQLRATPELLAQIAGADSIDMSLQTQLRRDFPAELVVAALQLHESRVRARKKFSRADEMWLTRVGVEQSTAEAVAQHKAERFHGADVLWDVCCGIGSDSIALAQVANRVEAVDLSEAACLRASWNCEVYGVANSVNMHVADATSLDYTGKLVHIDPDRRAGQTRSTRIETYQPGLEFLQQLTTTAAGGAIKLSPASNFGGKFPDCEVELISYQGECKEATVWFGRCRRDDPWRATVLPAGATLSGDPFYVRSPVGPLQQYLYDPNPAVVRAGLIDVLATQEEFTRLDAAEEYLTSDQHSVSPFVSSFQVLESFPYNRKQLARIVAEHEIGELEIKCRHVPVDVDALRKKLKLSGHNRCTLFIAKIDGRTRYVLAERMDLA